ncbi:MAG: BMP family protein [Eubacteriales bacterium]|nr:BMP family protein [Eubacteriales bacterium]
MKKRTGAVLLAVSLTVGTVTVPATSVAAEGDHKVAMLLDSSISDGGWGASCYQAMVDAAEEMGWETAYTDNVKTSDFATVMTDYADLEYDLIFAPGNEYTDAVVQVSEEYPDTYFCLLNGAIETDNVISVMPDAQQIGYLAGALAGLMTQTNNVGFIGGMEIDTTKTKLECYEAAVKKVNPDVNVSSAYAGSYDDAAKGKEIASSMVSTYDVDVMFGDASAVDTGAREALADTENKFSIGQPGDLGSAEDEVIICSVVTDNAALVKECMEAVEAGEYGNRTIFGNLEDGCLQVGTFSDKLVSKEIQDKYMELVEQIQAGTFIEE